MSLRIHGNRLLKTLPGQATRPTSARVREAVFNIWRVKITGYRWLDLCAGSGAMGAEALSRGAAAVVGIEQSGRACGVIRQNWRQVAKPEQSFQVMRGDVTQQLKRLAGQQFDCVYFDPPYASGLYQPVLSAIAQHSLLTPTGEIAVEHNPDCWEAESIPGLAIIRQKRYSSTALTFYNYICS